MNCGLISTLLKFARGNDFISIVNSLLIKWRNAHWNLELVVIKFRLLSHLVKRYTPVHIHIRSLYEKIMPKMYVQSICVKL